MTRMVPGIVLVVVGAVLALAFPELRVLWFEGRPLGVVLVVVGTLEAGSTFLRERRAEAGRRP